MGAFIDLTGQSFGRLTVKSRVAGVSPVRWEVSCSCGNNLVVRANSLRMGTASSCGCLRSELLVVRNRSNLLPFEVVAKKDTLCHYICNARNRSLEWGISDEWFYILIQSPCYWCGNPPANVSKIKGREELFLYSGVDRLDNLLGYVVGNVVPCCFPCNQLKGTVSAVEFESRIIKIFRNRGGRSGQGN